MVLAYHIILSFYGFWLPNDPRGSWSNEVWARHLRVFGPATKVATTRSVASAAHDRNRRLLAKQHLKYPAVRLTGAQARAVARGFARIIVQLGLQVHACSIMPDHVHLVVLRRRLGDAPAMAVEEIAEHLKRAASRQLNWEGIHPLKAHRTARGRVATCWAEHGWHVYLSTPKEIVGRIAYVEKNPEKSGLRRQGWSFVIAYR